jgi:hypothetical protein
MVPFDFGNQPRLISMQKRTQITYLTMIILLTACLASCGGPSVTDESEITPNPTETEAVVVPSAAVGATTGAACESGTLKIRDLPEVETGWRDGMAIAKARALVWQEDAVLIELQVSCELFESGFRWQATFFSRNAQAYYTADTAEVIPVNLNPDTIIPLPEEEIDFVQLHQVLTQATELLTTEDDVIRSLDVRVSTTANPIGPAGVPVGGAIYHVSLQSRGEVLELYVDAVLGNIHQYD